jgi:serine/threonine protein kinase
MYSYGRR